MPVTYLVPTYSVPTYPMLTYPVHILCPHIPFPHIPSPHRSVKRPKKVKMETKSFKKSEIPGKVCIQNMRQKSPKNPKIQGYNSPKKKNREIYQKRSVKGLKKRK